MAQQQIAQDRRGPRVPLYEEITNRIIAELEAGRLPWVQPWGTARAAIGLPFNAASERRYSGINILTLWHAVIARGFTGHGFLTFRQAAALGGSVRRGEHGTAIIYSHRVGKGEANGRTESGDPRGEGKGGFSFLKQFTVFSVDQREGLPERLYRPVEPVPEGLILPEAEQLIAATGADVRIGGVSAYYSPRHDFVAVPRPDDFFEPINWHRTAFHELGHWTGHASRLDRDQSGSFGSKPYGQEELVAEMTGAFVCAAIGIAPTVRRADYIGSWLEIIREDHRAILRAASAASKAADYLLAFRPDANATDPAEGPAAEGAHGGGATMPNIAGRVAA
ncbi:antirestriction protein ArdC [Sphingopyxis sp. OAS728]|uniref:ArdC family protein n=1 Tax=Sphingopyxis sp. OAS728 TaxID=2663823 RepID=UPI001789F082|nr:zincin-like metallopeptidase domain-containing protein [Sphingopyxis sp. OAS728]MBE1527923.1 antirestriction protein ArdC [Sphingopyxis sp. OAS728]